MSCSLSFLPSFFSQLPDRFCAAQPQIELYWTGHVWYVPRISGYLARGRESGAGWVPPVAAPHSHCTASHSWSKRLVDGDGVSLARDNIVGVVWVEGSKRRGRTLSTGPRRAAT
ncbi:hypothetical protein J3458_019737 [Metarhizium acridum]|uniref:uncharacterized protein n=1 Tax=Metarhizium acridum TaxID=92637 RepID=UPI001C6CD386|nr:hypothetical protein J3458_019737 [Metarhizium acridum]